MDLIPIFFSYFPARLSAQKGPAGYIFARFAMRLCGLPHLRAERLNCAQH